VVAGVPNRPAAHLEEFPDLTHANAREGGSFDSLLNRFKEEVQHSGILRKTTSDCISNPPACCGKRIQRLSFAEAVATAMTVPATEEGQATHRILSHRA
jgi:ribosomal protein S21